MVSGSCLNFVNSPILFSFLLYMHLESNRMHIGFLDLLTQSYWKETGTPKSQNFCHFLLEKVGVTTGVQNKLLWTRKKCLSKGLQRATFNLESRTYFLAKIYFSMIICSKDSPIQMMYVTLRHKVNKIEGAKTIFGTSVL